jgi:hypothetical protein
MAYDPARAYEDLFGHKPNTPEPREFKVFRKVTKAMMASVEAQGPAVVRQLVILANKNKLSEYLEYVFFAFNENRRDWPYLPTHLYKALSVGRWIMRISGSIPNYSSKLDKPPEELEVEVDKTLVEMSRWCYGDLRHDLVQDYVVALKNNTPAYLRVKGEVPGDFSIVHFKVDFEQRLSASPSAFEDGEHIIRLIRFISI